MKHTLNLTILAFIFLCLYPSHTAAQRRDNTLGAPVKKVEPSTVFDRRNKPALVGTPPKIMGVSGGGVYDINALDGTTANSHTPKYLGGMSMNFDGFAVGANDTLYGLTSANLTNGYNSHLFVIGPNYGANRFETLNYGTPLYLNGNRLYCQGEGDLAYDNKGGELYVSCLDGVWKLFTINPNSGVASFKGFLPAGGIYPAIAFNRAGVLYALDTNSRKLWMLDKTNPINNPQVIPLTVGSGQQLPNTSTSGGIGFSDDGGLYAAFGGQFVAIDPSNGALFTIRGNNGGYISGLVVSGGSGPVRQN